MKCNNNRLMYQYSWRRSYMVTVSTKVEFFFSFPHRSVIVSFKILPKILSLFPHSNNSSDSSKLLKWAIKELDLMECFFDNLKDFSSSCLQAKSTDGEDIIAEREQQIQARLDFITALFSNEMTPDHFRKVFTVRCYWGHLGQSIQEWTK